MMRSRFGKVVGTTVAGLVLACFCPDASAESGEKAVAENPGGIGTSSRAAFQEAIAALPLSKLPQPQAEAVRRALKSTTLYRRLPTQSIECHRAVLDFSLDHPEAIVDVWRVLDISHLRLDPSGPRQWRLADGYGTVGMLRLLHHEKSTNGGTMLLVGSGGYSGSLTPKPLSGSCIILLRHRSAGTSSEGRARQSIVVDAFLDMDGIGLEIVTRTLQPLIVRSAAWNVREICMFVSELSHACEENPEGVARLADRLSQTDAKHRAELAAIARNLSKARTGEKATASHTADAERLQLELASRWLPAESLPVVK